jgi:hypothetical protein
VIHVIPFVMNGMNGFVDLALLGSSAMVTAQQNGVVVQSTSPNAQTGEFLLARLAPGNYDVVFTANGRATAVIAAVPVVITTSMVMLSSNATPIILPVSATHVVSGMETSNPASPDEVAYATAKQTFGGAPIVTVKFVAADDSAAGAYALTLPVGAPLLGHYGAGMPVALVAQAGVAGKYTVEASETGYQTQSVGQDISAADATQNFVLVP